MAKSARASTKKSNRTKIRARVFKPVENARAERLSAKLMALASQPKPERDVEMQLDSEMAAAAAAHEQQHGPDVDIDMDEDPAVAADTKTKPRTKKSTRVQKKRRGKPASSITFPTYRKGRKVTPKDKKKK